MVLSPLAIALRWPRTSGSIGLSILGLIRRWRFVRNYPLRQKVGDPNCFLTLVVTLISNTFHYPHDGCGKIFGRKENRKRTRCGTIAIGPVHWCDGFMAFFDKEVGDGWMVRMSIYYLILTVSEGPCNRGLKELWTSLISNHSTSL